MHSILKLVESGLYRLELNNKKYVIAAPRAMCTLESGYIPIDYVFEIRGTNAADVKSQLKGKDNAVQPKKNKAIKRAHEFEFLEDEPLCKKAVVSAPALPVQHVQEAVLQCMQAEPVALASPEETEALTKLFVTQSELISSLAADIKALSEQHEEECRTSETMRSSMNAVSELAQKLGIEM